MESEAANLFGGDGAECRYDQHTIGGHDARDFLQRCARVRQATQISHQRSRFCVSPEELPRNRPGVGCDDVIALFEELRPQQRPLRPFRTEDAEPSATSGKPAY
ncbi:MAG: hypothetical protein DMF87_09810 [Acidobacteria bacterium]|nr:MAG: hypothetical protein DMF87_09810 [Acidobacteriota bacterium]